MKKPVFLKLERDRKYLIGARGIVDVRTGQVEENVCLAVEGGRIRWMGPADSELEFYLPYYLTPGFVDCHVHLGLGLDGEKDGLRVVERGERVPVEVRKRLKTCLHHGVVLIRDGGDKYGVALRARTAVADRMVEGPETVSTGFALCKMGGYGSFLGRPVSGVKEIEDALEQLADLKVGQVKVIISGIVSFRNFGEVGKIQFTSEELEFLVEAARVRGLKVMAHASGREAVMLAVRAGVHSVEHGYFVEEDTLEEMAERGTAWVPTVIPVFAALQRADESSGTVVKNVVEKTYRKQLETIRRAAALGVKMGIGTDAGAVGVGHGEAFRREMALYHEAGLTPRQIWEMATLGGAEVVGAEQDYGTLTPGKVAAFLGFRENPIWKPPHLLQPDLVAYPV
ncbi:amidohydrolase family protein [Calderihabitans maritimus]|uniref:Amidohydrolase n=1 Tax=Calderihabitans maritimus TaxID=1246530 RepID=A0A1Z5HRG2_9FIRM|nr:amidohydrolase family protein [Calderihabitans maritimus]GAW91860.1 amidohydrolase [Calderihabitans maritimus]